MREGKKKSETSLGAWIGVRNEQDYILYYDCCVYGVGVFWSGRAIPRLGGRRQVFAGRAPFFALALRNHPLFCFDDGLHVDILTSLLI